MDVPEFPTTRPITNYVYIQILPKTVHYQFVQSYVFQEGVFHKVNRQLKKDGQKFELNFMYIHFRIEVSQL